MLFTVGSGPVRGFAVTLGIGIITSVFTAIYRDAGDRANSGIGWRRPKTIIV